MVNCSKCRHPIQSGDEYFTDFDTVICLDCLDSYILSNYDFCDIAEELGMAKKVAPEEPREKPEAPIVGQMDMFGGVVGENEGRRHPS